MAWLVAALLLLLGAWLRFHGVGMQLLVDDEWHALNIVQAHDYAYIFSHFGHADHSIPLSLWYEWLSHTIGLSEMGMRWPSLLAGMALLIAVPALLRPWLGMRGQLLLTGLLAISPLLIFYSRFARPYAVVAVLASCAALCAWRWWRACEAGRVATDQASRGRAIGWAFAWLSCAVLAGWFNPVSLAVGFAPFAWFGLLGIRSALVDGQLRPLVRLLPPGLLALLVMAALLAMPVANDWASLAVKSGLHQPGVDTLWGVMAFFAGSGHAVSIALMWLLAALGWWALHRRDAPFAWFLAVVVVLATGAVSLTGAEWIHQAIVPARYLIGLLPLFLALVAAGTLALLDALLLRFRPAVADNNGHGTWLALVTGSVLLVSLVATGPLREWRLGSSPLAHHAVNYFELRPSANPFIHLFDAYPPEPFYAEIAAAHPGGDALVVEAPWYFISSHNPLHLHQGVHGQALQVGFVNGLCAGPLRGEVRADAKGIRLRNFVFLREWLQQPVDRPAYLVLRRRGVANERPHDFDFERCAQAAEAALGEPWYRSDRVLVFRRAAGA